MEVNETQNLIAELEHKSSKVAFSNVHFSTQKVLIRYMAIQGDAWSGLISEKLWSLDEWAEQDWRSVVEEINQTQGSRCFRLFEVPTVLLTEHIFAICDDVSSGYDSWQEYHDWYLEHSKEVVPDVEGCPACVYIGGADVLETGWELLHHYVCTERETIPLVSFC